MNVFFVLKPCFAPFLLLQISRHHAEVNKHRNRSEQTIETEVNKQAKACKPLERKGLVIAIFHKTLVVQFHKKIGCRSADNRNIE